MFNDTKIVLYHNKVILYNYSNFKDLSDTIILIDNYQIKGDNLKITELDSYYLIITGLIKEVSFID